MFIKTSIVLFTIFGISLLHCMESELKISKKKIIKQKSQSILRKLSNEKINEEPTVTVENLFIIAVHTAIESKDYTAVKFHLRNPHFDPNITDQQGYSALQIFIKAKACQGVELLLRDYRVHFRYEDLYKEDSNHIRIFECLDKSTEASQLLRQKIFARFTLDMVTHDKCESIKSFHKHNRLTEVILTETISKIKTAIEQAAANQIETHAKNDKSSVLPELAGNLPDYATNEFIEKKIWFILSSLQNTNNI
jgi:hypothetical protein